MCSICKKLGHMDKTYKAGKKVWRLVQKEKISAVTNDKGMQPNTSVQEGIDVVKSPMSTKDYVDNVTSSSTPMP